MDEKKLDGFARTLFKSLTGRVHFAAALTSLPSASSSSSAFGAPPSGGAPPLGDDRTAAVARRACARSSRFSPYWRDAAARKKACRGLGNESQSHRAPLPPDALHRDGAAWSLAAGAELRPWRDDGAPAALVPAQPHATAHCCLSRDRTASADASVLANAAAETGAANTIASGPLGEDAAVAEQHFDAAAATHSAACAIGSAAAEFGLVAGDATLAATATTESVSAATMVPAQGGDAMCSSGDRGGLLTRRFGSFRFVRSSGGASAVSTVKGLFSSIRRAKGDGARSTAVRAPLRDVKNVQSIDGAPAGDSSSSLLSSNRCREPAAAAVAGDRRSADRSRPASQDVSVCDDFGASGGTRDCCQPTAPPENPEAQTIAKSAQADSDASDAKNASSFKLDCDIDQPRDIASSHRCCCSDTSSVARLVPVDEMQILSSHHSSNCSTPYVVNVPPPLATTDVLSSLWEPCAEDCSSAIGTPAAVAASSNGLLASTDCDAEGISTCTSTAESDKVATMHTLAHPDMPSCMPTAASGTSRMFDAALAEFVKAERSYVRNLSDVIIGYKNHCEKYEELFSKGDVMLLFGNISDIYRFSCELLSSVEQCVTLGLQPSCNYGIQDGITSHATDQTLCRTDYSSQNLSLLLSVQSSSSVCCNLARCFLDRAQGFLVYSDYCSNHDRAAQLYASLVCEARYRSFFEGCHLLQGMGKIPLGGFLLTPVQKICKYHLQLADLVRHSACAQSTVADGTSKGCCQVLSSALARMRDVVHQVNENKRLAESRRAIEEWQVKVAHWQGDDVSRGNSRLVHYGELVLEGRLVSEKSGVLKRVSRRKRHYYLFDCELVECRKASSLHGGKQLSLCRRYRLRTAGCCADAATDGATAAAAAAPSDCPTDADVLWELVDSECTAADDASAGSGSAVRLGSAKSPHSLLLRPTRRLVNGGTKDGGVALLCARTAAEKAEWLQAIESLSRV